MAELARLEKTPAEAGVEGAEVRFPKSWAQLVVVQEALSALSEQLAAGLEQMEQPELEVPPAVVREPQPWPQQEPE